MSCSSLHIQENILSLQSLNPQNLKSTVEDIINSIIPTIIEIEKGLDDDLFIDDYNIHGNIENNILYLYFHLCAKVNYDDNQILNLLKDSQLILRTSGTIRNSFRIDIDNKEDAKKVLTNKLVLYAYPKNVNMRRIKRDNIGSKRQYIKLFVTSQTSIHVNKLEAKYRIDKMKEEKADQILEECLKVERETIKRIEEYLEDNMLQNIQIDIYDSMIEFKSVGYYRDVQLYISLMSSIDIPLSVYDGIQTYINYNISYMKSSSKDDVKNPIMLHDDEYFIVQDITENVNVIVLDDEDFSPIPTGKDYRLSEVD